MLTLLLACDRDPAAEDPLVQASKEVTFGTVKTLGPHRMQASITTTTTPKTGGAPTVSQESISLAWQDDDTWRYAATRDGKLRNEVVIWEGQAWRNLGARWERSPDAELWRVQLGSVWDPWATALQGLQDDVRLVPGDIEEVEGRRAVVHRVELVPAPEGPRRRPWTTTAAEGTVWVDEQSALRLVGDVRVVAESTGKSMEITLKFATSGIGMSARVEPPPPIQNMP